IRAVGGGLGSRSGQAGEGRRGGSSPGDVEVHAIGRPLPLPSRARAREGGRQGSRTGNTRFVGLSATHAGFVLPGSAPATAEEGERQGARIVQYVREVRSRANGHLWEAFHGARSEVAGRVTAPRLARGGSIGLAAVRRLSASACLRIASTRFAAAGESGPERLRRTSALSR